MERDLVSLIIGERQINTTTGYLTIRTVKIKKTNQYQVLMRMWSNWNSHALLVRMGNGAATLDKQSGRSSKSSIQRMHHPAVLLPDIYPNSGKVEAYIHTEMLHECS